MATGGRHWASLVVLIGLGQGCALREQSPLREAVVLSSRGQDERAAELVEAYLAKHPKAVPERRLAVRLRAATGDLGKARAHAERLAIELGPASPLPWIELGHALELAHRYEEALVFYDRAAESAPTDPLGPRTGGLRAAAWGEVDLAEPRLIEALRRNSRDAEAWHALGLVRAHQGDLDGAEQAYRSGLAAMPEALENRIGLATLALLRDQPEVVLREYEAILRARPRFADAHLGRSWALVRLRRFDEAEAALRRAADAGADQSVIAKQRRWLETERNQSVDSSKTPGFTGL